MGGGSPRTVARSVVCSRKSSLFFPPSLPCIGPLWVRRRRARGPPPAIVAACWQRPVVAPPLLFLPCGVPALFAAMRPLLGCLPLVFASLAVGLHLARSTRSVWFLWLKRELRVMRGGLRPRGRLGAQGQRCGCRCDQGRAFAHSFRHASLCTFSAVAGLWTHTAELRARRATLRDTKAASPSRLCGRRRAGPLLEVAGHLGLGGIDVLPISIAFALCCPTWGGRLARKLVEPPGGEGTHWRSRARSRVQYTGFKKTDACAELVKEMRSLRPKHEHNGAWRCT